MAPRRLVPASKVADWDARLAKAAGLALDDMRAQVNTSLRHAGVEPVALVAASKKTKAVGIAIGAGLTVWSADQWLKAVDTHVKPVTAQVAREATRAAQDAVPAAATWGMPSSADAIGATLVAGAVAAGAYLGTRMNSDVASAADPTQAATDVFATANDIIGGQLGAAAEQAGNTATTDVASYLAGYMGNVYSDATKTWNAVGDDKTRDWHMDADGQEVGLNDVFIVDGEAMTGPGDPSASDSNTLNCRCWVTTDGIDPGVAIYGEDDTTDASAGLEDILNRAGATTSLPTSPRSYPN